MDFKNKGELAVIFFSIAVCIMLGLNAHSRQEALDACIEDISNECGATISYALSLERENARLHKELEKHVRIDAPPWVQPKKGN